MSIFKVLTDEELEEALNNDIPSSPPSKVLIKPIKKPKYKTNRYIKVFKDFQFLHNLDKGDYWVEPGIIFYIYDNWSHKNKRSSMSFFKFRDLCKLFVNNKIVNNHIWFGISEQFKQQCLTQDVLNKATEWSRKHRGIQKAYRSKKTNTSK